MTGIAPERAEIDQLYWEARGSGRPLLLIAGTPGDGGQFDRLVNPLADDHLVITYDRRGTSRSRRTADSGSTSVAEEADDAAAVLSAIGVAEALVFGTSNGALVGLELALRHPRRVAAVILHEPPLLSVMRDPAPVESAMGSMIGSAMETGGPVAALEAFLRFAFGDEIVDGWPAELRQRMLSNAERCLSVELPAFQEYRPDAEAIATLAVPASVLVGEQQEMPFFGEVAEWLARQLRTEVNATAGAHGPHFSHPEELAATIRRHAASA
jgi:pimeloyl-ACP methyl ester carboxylesterase